MDVRRKANYSPIFLRHYTYDPPPLKSTGRCRVARVLLWSSVLIGLPVVILALSWLSTLPDTDPLVRTNPTSTALMDHRLARAAEQRRTGKRQWIWTPLSRIAPELQRAVVAAEDASFFIHEGFDWEGIKEAAKYNLEAGELKRGGSTITQQLAKNLYLSSERSLFRKAREALDYTRARTASDQEAYSRTVPQCRRVGTGRVWGGSRGSSSLRKVCLRLDGGRSGLAGCHSAQSRNDTIPSRKTDLPHPPASTYSPMDGSSRRHYPQTPAIKDAGVPEKTGWIATNPR